MQAELLHGTLVATIFEVEKLSGVSCFNFLNKTTGSSNVKNYGKRLLTQVKRTICCDPVLGSKLYATIDLDKTRVARTGLTGKHHSNPIWKQSFYVYCAHTASNVIFTIKEDELVSAILMGRAYVPVRDIIGGNPVDRWVDILDEQGNPIPGNAKIHVKLQFISVAVDGIYSKGVRSSEYMGLPHAFFNQRSGCQVTLYQDAHVPDNFGLLRDGQYKAHKCWEDIFHAISNAEHLIYITGWSVNTNIALLRDPNRKVMPGDNSDSKLGNLLIRKASEGVTVLVLIWDDRTSTHVPILQALKSDGIMATHDEDTEKFFANSHVHCVKCPRTGSGKFTEFLRHSVRGTEVSAMFTHHQKAVVVDCKMENDVSSKRRIVSFIGGIDLCDGRYDTQDHPLFKTLNTVHADDFHQPNFVGSSIKKGGPREPWHDIHCKLEGPVAWDVLYNFEQRWKKQVGDKFLIPREQLETEIVRPLPVLPQTDPEAWNVRIFRSIDSTAVDFPSPTDTKPDNLLALGLVRWKEEVIEQSIQDAYINAIRRAQNFIYIENQYFVGSSFAWKKSPDIKVEEIGALHLIPKELSLKILSKIEASERFAVYIVIPMWPEGIPESDSVQAILDWQRRTIEMMYTDIAKALLRKGIDANPRDYLTFFCLGNRETKKLGEFVPTEVPKPDSDYARAQHSRRFMIYVHAKMMIVDDEYIIVGSANINQRSMDGSRDTEIAMGAYQPQHLTTMSPPMGQIYRFRMSLWYEHLGMIEQVFQNPATLECIQFINSVAAENWVYYASETFGADMDSHLLMYPINVDRNGAISALPGFEHFPDTNAPILGTPVAEIINKSVDRFVGTRTGLLNNSSEYLFTQLTT